MTAASRPTARSPGRSPVRVPLDAPLIEGRWLWRRLFVFTTTAMLGLLLVRVIEVARPDDLVRIADGLIGLMALMAVLYLVAPTAQQLVELLAALRLRLETGGRR